MRDRYTITERLDQGGMAEVFRGVAESMEGFKKNVAIKRILPSLTKNPKFISMFLDEARLSLYLQHANIVQVFDISKTPDNAYFLVMEYVDGCNLKSLIERQKQRGKRIEIAHAIYMMIEACKGLNYAHALENPETGEPLGIVHRDISPPNILLSKNGEVKLVDFGLAKANSQIESTDPGVVKGKFSYLSPEAASGLEVDARADVFAVGIILWELFTGRRLFYGDTDYQTVELVRQARVPSIAALNPEIEPELEQVVRKALARDPDERYQSAADLGDALAQYLFSRRMKVTARDIQALVRDTQMELMRKRSAEPKESLIDALIQDEVAKLASLVGGEESAEAPRLAEGSVGLDPKEFIDTSSWAADLADQSRPVQAPHLAHGSPAPSAPKAAPRAPARPPARPSHPPTPAPPTGGGDVDSLSQMLEPDRTGLHKNDQSNAITIAVIAIIVLLVGIGVAMFAFKDKIF
jgi:serine/threonine-protein kinase